MSGSRAEHRHRRRHGHRALAQRADRVADRQHAASTTWCSRPAAARASRTRPSRSPLPRPTASRRRRRDGFARAARSFTLTANNNGVDTLTASALGIQATISVNVSADAFVVLCAGGEHGGRARHSRRGHRQLEAEQRGRRELADHVLDDARHVERGEREHRRDRRGDRARSGDQCRARRHHGDEHRRHEHPAEHRVRRDHARIRSTCRRLRSRSRPTSRAPFTATVRDPTNNFVKNQTVNFELTDVTGGSCPSRKPTRTARATRRRSTPRAARRAQRTACASTRPCRARP